MHVVVTPSEPSPRTVWTVVADERPRGRLEGRRYPGGLVVVDRLVVEAGAAPSDVVRALADALAQGLVAREAEVLVVEREELAPLAVALPAAGLRVRRRKVFVERELSTVRPASEAAFTTRSLADVGEAAFLERLTLASEGDPFEAREGVPRDVEREWRDLVASAGPRLDPSRWWLADDAAGPVGVVLPQRVNATTGTLSYVGVLPARRGRGMGRALHAFGLGCLAAGGLVRYVGSTDVRNAAMRRVFAVNDCPVRGTESYWGR
ncbi:MAG: GNAT family N-acetyltransferase [Planctomycetes bacterium]|nr:GNAT family N-acetyltransferase [Planctomycetota bacterium]